ncbi:MAG: phosphotransferase [Betaproteobacteria bacterium]|nr:phosphotransferase [Betaproteobacteria bacterium]
MDRYALVHDWLTRQLPGRTFSLSPASADASFRRYFRVTLPDATLIVMDAPPEHEDCRPFVHVAGLMAAAGMNVPAIFAQDLAQGLLLLSDLGSTTYLAALSDHNADSLFGDATDTLIRWQLASREAVLPLYDEALLRRELDLFPEWYLRRHLGIELNARQRQSLETVFRLVLASNLAQPRTYVHRDYMPRNLMLTEPNPGVLDFQDAVYGPITYDVASLFKDAFISWDERRILDWTIRYWEKARQARLPVNADFGAFYRDFEWMGLQRHLKVLGIFARICHRDGKPTYVKDTPRFLGYVRTVSERYAPLSPLLHLLDQFADRKPAIGYTF